MKYFFKQYLEQSFKRRGYFPTRMTDKASVKTLIKKLIPLNTDKELIRMGPCSDGGYLVPDDMEGVQACFSPGVSTISGFEKDCVKRGMDVYLADASVESSLEQDPRFHFSKKFIGAYTADDFISFETWVNSSLSDDSGELILQMDIEGYEYETILSISDAMMRRFRIIVVEFHSLDQLWNEPFFNLSNRAFCKILESHLCVHIHPNNYGSVFVWEDIEVPEVMEFTFLRKDRVSDFNYQKKFPHPLDCDNDPESPSLILPDTWYSK